MSREKKIRHAKLLLEKARREKKKQLIKAYKQFYPWQREFNAATKENMSCALMAANQVGKTITGTAIDAMHLLGDYPDDWEGHKFESGIIAWLLGYSGEKTRDLLQQKLFGRLEKGGFEGGLIPKERILGYRSMSGTVGAVREVTVLHKDGTKSYCRFWSYTQGQHALMGDVVDWFHIDEEPKDHEIYPQVITRLLNGDKGRGGRGILTFTPENGKTELVKKFMDEPDEGMYLLTATWDDAPHLSEEAKRRALASYPSWQHDMRSKGIPLMGSGLIYQVSEESIKCDPFIIPDHWFVINAMDFGWDHPQSNVQLAWDKENDAFYIVNAWRAKHKHPFEAWQATKSWSENVPTAWPGDGLQHKQQGEGKEAVQQYRLYTEAGFKMLHDHATFEDGGNGVWVGIHEISNAMTDGRFKIFSHLNDVFSEVRQYHTKTLEDGKIKIVKVGEDLLDAIRYAMMMRRFAIPMSKVRNPNPEKKQRATRDWRAM